MDATEKSISSETRTRLEELVKKGIVNNGNLFSFMAKQEDRFNKKNGRKNKKNQPEFPILLSYQQSRQALGSSLIAPEKLIPETNFSPQSIFLNPEFNWGWAWLNGFSVQKIKPTLSSELIFNGPDRYSWYRENRMIGTRFNEDFQPGYYLISIKNTFVNLPVIKENEMMPGNTQRIYPNLALEFFMALDQFPQQIYYRTEAIDNHGKYFCLGKKDGSFHLKPFNGGKYQKTIQTFLIAYD